MTLVRLDALTLDVPPQVIAYAVAPLLTTLASAFGTPGPIRVDLASLTPPAEPVEVRTVEVGGRTLTIEQRTLFDEYPRQQS